MANRTFDQDSFQLVKRRVSLYCAVNVAEDGAVTMQRWNYPTFGTGVSARTYTAATTASGLPSGAAYPRQYQSGSEGVLSVTRTAVGEWSLVLQDSYQRVLGVNFTELESGGASVVARVAIAAGVDAANSGFASGNTISLVFKDYTGATADPGLCGILLEIVLADATEP